MHRLTVQVTVLLVGSGLAALVYQTGWFRMLRLVFGSTTQATATVLAVFMGGLGFGGYVLGKRADRHPNPLALYANLELAVSVAALASPFLIEAVGWIYVQAGGTVVLGEVAGTMLRLVLGIGLLAVPTFLMGGTLPAAVRAVETMGDRGRRRVGILYGANTIGAVIGAFLASFLMLEVFGTRWTIWQAALLNLLIALVARAMARRIAPPGAAVPEPAAPAAVPASPPPERGFVQPAAIWVYAAAFVTGFSFFLMELVWYRLLTPILSSTVYTFGLILVVALAGIGIGGALYGLGARNRRPTVGTFAVTLALEALFLILPFASGDGMAFLAWALRPMAAFGFVGLVAGWAVVAALTILPAAILAGVQFPMLIGLIGEGDTGVGGQLGRTYAWNTVGSIVGSLAGGFLAVPLLGAENAWRLAVGLLAVFGLATAAYAVANSGRRWAVATAGALVVVAVGGLAADGPGAVWRHSSIGAGRLLDKYEATPNDLIAVDHKRRNAVIWETDGREVGVAVDAGDGIAMIANGKSDGSVVRDAANFIMRGLIGTMLHPEPQSALTIGLGTGMTVGWLAAVSTVTEVDVVELEPAVTTIARMASAANLEALENPAVNMIIADGREYLLTTPKTYDVISSEPSNPYRAGVAALFTVEFYRAVLDRLNRDGIFVQWLQGYEVEAGTVQTVAASVGKVFPYVEIWRLQTSDILLVAAREPIRHDPRRVDRRANEFPYRHALADLWGVRGAAGFYGGFVAGDPVVRALQRLNPDRLNTDDRTRIEFAYGRTLGREGGFDFRDLYVMANRLDAAAPPFARGSGPDPAAIAEARRVIGVTQGWSPPSGIAEPAARARQRARVQARKDHPRAAVRIWSNQPGVPYHPGDVVAVGGAMAQLGAPMALTYAASISPVLPAAAANLRGKYAMAVSDPRRALVAYRAMADAVVRRPAYLGGDLLDAVRSFVADYPDQVTAVLDSVLHRDQAAKVDYLNQRMDRAMLVQRYELWDRCVEEYAFFEPYPRWDESFLKARLECYLRNEDPRTGRAGRDLERFYANELAPLSRMIRLHGGLEPIRPGPVGGSAP